MLRNSNTSPCKRYLQTRYLLFEAGNSAQGKVQTELT